MKKEKRSLKNEEELNIQANLNNLEPGDSVNKQRALETGNLILLVMKFNNKMITFKLAVPH